MVILDPYGMTFDAVGAFGLAFHFLFKSCLSILCCIKKTIYTSVQKRSFHSMMSQI